jgi:hypothetical protein
MHPLSDHRHRAHSTSMTDTHQNSFHPYTENGLVTCQGDGCVLGNDELDI